MRIKKYQDYPQYGRVVFTGVAGAGKTTMLNAFEEKGYKVVPEVARELIAHYKKNDPSMLPWNNRDGFQEKVEDRQVKNFQDNKYGIFDRSLVDEIAYRNCYNVGITEKIDKLCNTYRYNKVFIFPFWDEIYKQDEVRTETPEEAAKLFDYLMNAYKTYGYDPIVVPKVSIEDRYTFILDRLN